MRKSFFLFLFSISSLSYLSLSSCFAREEFVVKSETEFNPTHENRFTFMFGLNPSLQKASDVSNIVFAYGKKLNDFWLDSTLMLTNGLFNKITTNNSAATGLSDQQLIDGRSTHTTLGIGIGRETQYSQTWLSLNDLHELMCADMTYNIFKGTTSSQTFMGPGLLTKFSMVKKFSAYFSAGTQLTYNLAVVKRASNSDSESSSNRSLTISYLTIGIDLSLYL